MRVRRRRALEGLAPKEAIRAQARLARELVLRGGLPRRLRTVAGVDCSPSPAGSLHACVVICRAPDWEVEEVALAADIPAMPYVPGLLSFREAPIVLEALRRVRATPDVVLVDGQGIAHPRGVGLASHLGLHIGVPTVGVGKSRLCGTHDEPGPHRGDQAALRSDGRRIGTVLRTRDRVKPVYVSPGHRLAQRPAVRAVLTTADRFRLPEPIRQADMRSRRDARKG